MKTAPAARAGEGFGGHPKPATYKARTKTACIFLCLLLSGLCLLATGCSVTRGTRHPDGTLVVTNYRALWTSEAVNFSLASSNLTVALRIGTSASDADAVGAITEGAVKGVLGRP